MTRNAHDPEQAYIDLNISQHLKLSDFSSDMIESCRKRYKTYLQCIDFCMYDEIGSKVLLLIYDFMNAAEELDLLAAKCQVIDKLILEIFDEEVKN